MPRLAPSAEARLVLAGFAALAVAGTWPLAAQATTALPGDLGDPLFSAWVLGWDAARLGRGLDGFWDAPIFFPSSGTLALSEHYFGVAVLVAPVYWLTRNAVLMYNTAFLLAYTLAGAGMYLLARSLTGNRLAAALAGVIFAFAPYRADHLSHLQMLSSGWMPISLWGLHRFLSSGSRGALAAFAAAFVMQALSNGYFLYFLSFAAALVIVFHLGSRRTAWRLVVRELAVAAVVILLALSPFVLAYVRTHVQTGVARSYSDLINFSADTSSYFIAAYVVRLYRWLPGTRLPEQQLFPGMVAVVLATVALWARPRPTPSAQSRGVSEWGWGPTSVNEGRSIAQDQSVDVRRGSRRPRAGRGIDARAIIRLYTTMGLVGFVLSLGPEPSFWGHRLGAVGPYLVLARTVPGMDGLRAPARISILVFVSLAVLSAIGASHLLDRGARIRRGAVGATLVILALAEGWMTPIPMLAFDPRGRPEDRAAYAWLARQPPGGVLELPILSWSLHPTLTYQFATLLHGHPIVNGYSGYGSGLQEFLGGAGSPLHDLGRADQVLAMLRAVGVRYVVSHPGDYEAPDAGEAALRALGQQRDHVARVREFGAATVLELAPQPSPADRMPAGAPPRDLQPIPAGRLRMTASHMPDRIRFAVDGDPETRWISRQAQSGDEWIQIDLDAPADVRLLQMRMARRSFGDYPRHLVIEGSGVDGRPAVLYQGDVLAPFGRGIVEGGPYPTIDLPLPPNRSQTLRLRQTATTRTWFWSLHELAVWKSQGER